MLSHKSALSSMLGFGVSIFLSSISVTISGASLADSGNQVVATVNGQKITRTEIYNDLLADQVANLNATDVFFKGKQRFFAQSVGAILAKKLMTTPGKTVTLSKDEIMDFFFADKSDFLLRTIDRVVQQTAVAQAGKAAGYKVTESEIAAQTKTALDGARKNYPSLGKKNDKDTLTAMGFRPTYLKPIVTTNILLNKMAKKDFEKQLGHPVADTDYVAASHILVRVNTDAQNPQNNDKFWNDAKAKIDAILADIKSGKTTFEKAAQENSDDGSKFQAGSLGITIRGKMVPEFDKVIFSAEKGKVSEPFKTQFGWHIARVDRLGSELTGPEKGQVLEQSLGRLTQNRLQEIMKMAKVDNKFPLPAQPRGGQMGAPN